MIIAFTIGITIFRQTHSIWDMTGKNAVSINTTLALMPSLEYVLVIISIIGIVLLYISIGKGFKNG